jgi:hypothetical protein
MKKLSISMLLATLFLLGCNSAPLFGEDEGEKMTMDFVELVRTDPAAAYQETEGSLQSSVSEEEFLVFAANPVVQQLDTISVEGINIKSAFYDSDYGGAVAKIDLNGSCIFTDKSTGTFSVTWLYDFDEEKWEIEAINFLPDSAQ